ncbi:MAG: GNAT family N-acetyltransferase [Alphaproteobacteria bacterium]|nr:GNAT family N-acetyltransferase [Alphaproteobacteria bacterium]
MKLDVTAVPAEFDAWVAALGVDDPYATLDWAARWASNELGAAFGIRGTSPGGTVLYPVVRVPLDALPGGAGRCDLRVAYDFGGPFATDPALLPAFDEAMGALRAEWRVVTEFGRLHPYRPLPPDARPHSEHVLADLGRDGVEASGTHQRFVRRAVREGLGFRMTDASAPADRAAFLALYRETMGRVGAHGVFRFPEPTLEAAMDHPRVHLALVEGEGVDAAALFLDAGATWFYFLGCSATDALPRRPNNLLFHEAIAFARDRGAARVHLGGGSESLLAFKRRIGNATVPYALWRRVHDPAAFEALAPAGEGFFPPWFPGLLAARGR